MISRLPWSIENRSAAYRIKPLKVSHQTSVNNAQKDRYFSIFVPVNYEDTDAGGIVYYANYLAYMERARNALLRELGYPLGVLANEHQVLFVVMRSELKYLMPGRLDDVLEITVRVSLLKGARVTFLHRVLRGAEVLVEGVVELAVLNPETFVPRRIPEMIRADFSNWLATSHE